MNTFTDDVLSDYNTKLKLKQYSSNTIIVYNNYFKHFLFAFKEEIGNLSTKQIENYVLGLDCQSQTKQNLVINAIKFYFEKVRYRKRKFYKLARPKQQSKLPQIVSREEILKAINRIKNIKHKAIISIAYSTGLRVSEVCNLKISDIDSKRMLILIRNGKGNKDRYVPLSFGILTLLREYYKQHKPKIYLFEGWNNSQYSIKSCQVIYNRYKTNLDSTFHTLRHSCFTHLLEHGTDIRIIQKLARHSNIKTTEIYTHVSNSLLNKLPLPL